jgi:hypothetical protein
MSTEWVVPSDIKRHDQHYVHLWKRGNVAGDTPDLTSPAMSGGTESNEWTNAHIKDYVALSICGVDDCEHVDDEDYPSIDDRHLHLLTPCNACGATYVEIPGVGGEWVHEETCSYLAALDSIPEDEE